MTAACAPRRLFAIVRHMTTFPGSPSKPTERVLVSFFALGTFGGVLAGGLVRPEPLAWVHAAETTVGFGAADWWALLFWPARYSWTPFVATVGWTFAGYLFAYFAVRRLFGAFAALAAAAGAVILGCPGWDGALPNGARFWTTPVALAAWLVALALSRRTAPWREWLAVRARERWLKLLWIGLLIFAFFVTAEQLRLGLRGANTGKFPYAENGLPRGVAKELDDYRRLHHAAHFILATEAMHRRGLLFDDALACLAGHGAAARFVCRIGAARPDVLIARRPPLVVGGGWSLERAPFGGPWRWIVAPGRTGLRYAQMRGSVEGVEAGNWFAARHRVQTEQPTTAEFSGPVDPHGAGKYLWIEIECAEGRDADAQATLGGEPLELMRHVLAAGDRTIVRFAAMLPPTIGSCESFDIRLQEPAGMWDVDLFLHDVELPPGNAGVRK